MLTILIESLIGIVLFTVVIVSVMLKNPLTSVGDYPPAIQKRCSPYCSCRTFGGGCSQLQWGRYAGTHFEMAYSVAESMQK
ncbi:MAG: hypothetical protein NC081_11985 [Roseburia sp.]|nr:hypothetical protein [Roseburia sp.]